MIMIILACNFFFISQYIHETHLNECSLKFQRAQQIAKSHNKSNPLFLYMAFQNVHSPVQAPKENVEKYAFIEDTLRRTYAGMVDIMDEAVGNITDAFKEAGYFIINNNIKHENLYALLKKPFMRAFLYLLTFVCHAEQGHLADRE